MLKLGVGVSLVRGDPVIRISASTTVAVHIVVRVRSESVGGRMKDRLVFPIHDPDMTRRIGETERKDIHLAITSAHFLS